jgi:AraC family transcriptional regulator of arabinose operon
MTVQAYWHDLGSDPSMDWRIGRALVLIEQRLEQPIRVRDLAAELNLSASRFGHLFQAECGCSPRSYIGTLRMERAYALLTETPLLVKQVMVAVGITDPSHFVREFRKRFGESPAALRSRIHGKKGGAAITEREEGSTERRGS